MKEKESILVTDPVSSFGKHETDVQATEEEQKGITDTKAAYLFNKFTLSLFPQWQNCTNHGAMTGKMQSNAQQTIVIRFIPMKKRR